MEITRYTIFLKRQRATLNERRRSDFIDGGAALKEPYSFQDAVCNIKVRVKCIRGAVSCPLRICVVSCYCNQIHYPRADGISVPTKKSIVLQDYKLWGRCAFYEGAEALPSGFRAPVFLISDGFDELSEQAPELNVIVLKTFHSIYVFGSENLPLRGEPCNAAGCYGRRRANDCSPEPKPVAAAIRFDPVNWGVPRDKRYRDAKDTSENQAGCAQHERVSILRIHIATLPALAQVVERAA